MRGTHGTGWRPWARLVARNAAALCVAGVALGDIHLDFTWQAWHNLTSTVVLRGRRGTHGVGWRAWARLVARDARHCAWQAWHLVTSTLISRGRRGTKSHPRSQAWHSGTGWRAWARLVARDAAALCVAGVALGDIHLDFTWQAWHNLTSTVVLRGSVALMALGGALGPAWSRVTPRHFAWQAWHLVTSTWISRGRRGTISHPRSFCVAGMALMALCGALGTPSFTHPLSHTILSHTIFQLC